ncbi:MAG: pyruvate formate lyase family protein [Candidatus Latescibacterota bacterium]
MERTQRLKARLFAVDDRVLFLDRMRILEECAAAFAEETAGVRFGRTLAQLLSRIPVVIEDDDLIVGRVHEAVPTEAEERWFEERREALFYVPWFQSTGHLTLSWERLLAEGLSGIRVRARAHLARLAAADGEAASRRDFLQGAVLCCDALEAYARRYAEHAEALAAAASTPDRQRGLQEVARVCGRVPTWPARTLHEAVQAVWLVDLVLHAVVGARDFALGRLDQYLYPFYQRDLENGRITADSAQELIECLYIKCSEVTGYADQANARKRSLCQDSVQYIVLGGQRPEGGSAVNPLSSICLRAGYLKLKQPTLKVRYHHGIDAAFWQEACRLVRSGGSVGVYNDDVVIPAFESVGVEPQDARNYVHYGCCNANVPGREGSLMERWHSLPKYLELALNDGLDPATDRRLGPATGRAEDLDTMEALLEALRLQVRSALAEERAQYPPLTQEDLRRCSFTLESVFLEDCIERGREWRLGGTRYWHKSQHASGIATVADSLAAIRELVYQTGEMDLPRLRDVLRRDFEGEEPLRQRLRTRMPKFGNDDPRVDDLAARVAGMFCDEVGRCNEAPHSVCFWPEIYSYHNNRWMGAQLGATADGRRRGESISENQSPSPGADLAGATACLRSLARLPLRRTPGGGTNLRLHPSCVAGERGLQALSDLLKTYFALGGQHLQLNLVDGAVLRQAQEHPDQYRDLSVRVVGYSAYFVTLSPDVQEDLIRRTEHQLRGSGVTTPGSFPCCR